MLKNCYDLCEKTKFVDKAIQQGKKERNRIEKRVVYVFHKKDYDLGDVWNDGVKTIIKVERETKIFNTKTKLFYLSDETAIYISTTDKLSAQKFGDVIRLHWRIENSNHYVRDVSLREDFSRIRKNPENVARLRSFALNIMRASGEKNISQALYRNALNVKRVLDYCGVRSGNG